MGAQEWVIVLVIVLVIFGGSQIPKLAKNLGKAQREFKDGLTEGEVEAAKERAATERAAADRAAAARQADITDTTARDDR